MRRKVLMVFLAIGAVVGFSSGFAHLHHHSHWRHRAFEAHVADVCVEAARRADRPAPPPAR